MVTQEMVYVAPSPIHGKGLFARTWIPEGTPIGVYEGTPATADGTHVLWSYDDDDRLVGRDGTNELRYLNHSESPNSEFDGFELFAVRPIAPDEEITINYEVGDEDT